MKKFLLFLVVLVLLVAAGVALFLATFDADRYRPWVIRKMSVAAGRPVGLERVSLRWRGGIAVDLKGLTVEPNLRAERVTAVVELQPLFQKEMRADIHVESGRLIGMNLLQEVFSRLSMIPGLSERLAAHLPESYRAKLEARDTLFEPIALRVTASEERVSTGPIRLATDSFALTAEGITMEKGGAVSFPAQFRMDADLSQAMIRSVEELAFLADDRGRLFLPVFVQGKPPQITVQPDYDYVLQRLLSGKGQELLGDLLQKALE